MLHNISITECIEHQLQQYFADLDGEMPCSLYEMIMNQAEESLFRYVMESCRHNQTRAAQILGLNRNTLRKKLIRYQLLQEKP
ncbi:helix-turn-helix domain-containing protein [Stenoxybacter acetivorans]|uniref:helix-turn-helix domain-containing protein n=1 Tax=Stenoxybacter acetivorans TaxID=422441 RepID=UPI000567728A|nr:helix-turn-helix domain-containing protein [Stenoxybacter acetivorans]